DPGNGARRESAVGCALDMLGRRRQPITSLSADDYRKHTRLVPMPSSLNGLGMAYDPFVGQGMIPDISGICESSPLQRPCSLIMGCLRRISPQTTHDQDRSTSRARNGRFCDRRKVRGALVRGGWALVRGGWALAGGARDGEFLAVPLV